MFSGAVRASCLEKGFWREFQAKNVLGFHLYLEIQHVKQIGRSFSGRSVVGASISRSRTFPARLVGFRAAVLGYRVGDTVKWEAPAGLKKLRVKEIVYQPEASGDYHC